MASTGNGNPGCLGALFGLGREGGRGVQKPEAQRSEALPYRLRDDFLSPAEKSFHDVLTVALESRLVVCPKVNLADIFFVTRPNENTGARSRISQKHLDFLLCEPGTMKPVLGIELDDSSHSRPDRQERDAFVDGVFSVAGLPLRHVPARTGYSVPELVAMVAPYIGRERLVEPLPDIESMALPSVPQCPKCGVPMVPRTSGRGDTKGSRFFGCPHYPKCRQVVPID